MNVISGKLTMNQSKDILADIAAAGTGVTATWTWVTHVNDALQLVATAVAIVAGVYAIRWHKVRIDGAVKKQKERKDDKDKSK
jgi:hypothetical protein